jgi:hypothetical protein
MITLGPLAFDDYLKVARKPKGLIGKYKIAAVLWDYCLLCLFFSNGLSELVH